MAEDFNRFLILDPTTDIQLKREPSKKNNLAGSPLAAINKIRGES